MNLAPARLADWPQIVTLVLEVGLPLLGLRGHLDTALVVRSDGQVVGCAALEPYGEFALLRSVAVHPSRQGQGLGQDLTAAALELARELGVHRVYLLTETAGEFFPRFGFVPVAREAIPDAVRRSVEFASACPVSALAMVLPLEQGPTGTEGRRDTQSR